MDELTPSEESLKTEQAISELETPEEIEAAREIFEENGFFNDSPLRKPKEDNLPEGEIEKAVETEKAPETAVETPKGQSETAMEGQTRPVEITDEYLKTIDEKDANILRPMAGEIMTPKAIKSYINAQRLIGKRAEDLIKQPIPEPKQEIKKDDFNLDINQLVVSQLKELYPDLLIPTDPEEYKEFVSDFNYRNPEQFLEFREKKRQIEQDVHREYNEIKYLRENHVEVNNKRISDQVDDILEQAKKMNIDLTEFGVNPALDKDGNNPLINELLFTVDKDGNSIPDPKVVAYGKKGTPLEGVPFIKDEQLVVKFFQVNMPKILQTLKANSRKEGFTTAQEKKTSSPKMIGVNSPSGEQTIRNISESDINAFSDYDKLQEMIKNTKIV